jgi:DNA-directed RNA polymerase delta subunit
MADLKTIIQITQDQLKKQVPTHQAVLSALDTLKSREAETVARRHGLRDGKVETLQEIGEGYGVSRERVRQIEKQGLKKFTEQLTKQPLTDILKLAVGLVREAGGVIGVDSLSREFLPESQHTPAGKAALRFLLETSQQVVVSPEDRDAAACYALTESHVAAADAIGPMLAEELTAKRQAMTPAELLTAFAKRDDLGDHSHLVTEPFVESVLEIGKGFVSAGEGTWGLATWADINPRNIREKTLYILKESGTPMHFTDVTEKIRAAGFDDKPVTTQAVHNELINGDQFVLIGRGIYALKEWGYLTGTVSHVIRKILEQAGEPMERNEIVQKVLEQRHVSENTILINLQDKKKFTRVGKSAYVVATPDINAPSGPATQAESSDK